MPIAALPQTTVRAIGSISVISDSCSVVKELLDNAIDASATSLLVEISQNSVDVIQLKDNGHGIPPEDHPNVCKHAFTSKIQTIDDLRNVGGSSLGFRGEALASVAEMSGSVTITTRVASEVTGSCVKYGRDGEILNSQRTSHPMGTTLRITDFLKCIPVRRQGALKNATKTLTAIKKLLQAYAFAQPSKRFSLKVIKAKNENNNWIYAPAVDATISDAAIKIVGKDVSGCCATKQISSPNPEERDQCDSGNYGLTAFLAKPDADLSNVNNIGQFVTIDGRPLSTARGIGQEIARLLKSYIRAAASRNENEQKIIDPFLCLHIECPPGAYDVNIEPAKDDVLFEERDIVLSLIEDLFREHYGPLPNARNKSPTKSKTRSAACEEDNHGFGLLMARKRPEISTAQPTESTSPVRNVRSGSPLRRSPRFEAASESPNGNNALEASTGTPHVDNGTSSRFVNPWSISRINASFQTPRRKQDTTPASSQNPRTSSPTEYPFHRSRPPMGHMSSPESPHFPSPPSTRLNSSSPVNRRSHAHATKSFSEARPYINSVRKATRQRDREKYGNGALDTWFMRTRQISLEQPPLEPTPDQEEVVPTLSELARQRFGSESHNPVQTGPVGVNNQEERGDGPGTDESPVSLSRTHDSESIQAADPSGSMNSGRGYPVLEKWAARVREGFQPETHLEVERALDFERRKKEAIQQYRTRSNAPGMPASSQEKSVVSHSPHHNRYLAAKAALITEPTPVYDQPSTTSQPQDPRFYFMRHQTDPTSHEASKDSLKLRRLPTNRLPLERIPDGYDLHDTCLPLPVDPATISKDLDVPFLYDSYPQRGKYSSPFAPSDMESLVPMWNERLATLINQQYKSRDNLSHPQWQIDLSPIIAKHLSQTNKL